MMKMRAIILSLTLLGLATAPMRGQEPDRQQPDDLLDRIDEARIRVDLLEMEVAADRRLFQKMLEVLRETELLQVQGVASGPVIGGSSPEEREVNIARYERKLDEVRDRFVERSRELGRERRRVAELEGRRDGRPGAAASPVEDDRRGRAPARLLEQFLKELERPEGR